MGNPEVYFLSCSATNARCCYGGITILNCKGLLQLTVWRMEEKCVKASQCRQNPYPCRSRAGVWCVAGSESRDSQQLPLCRASTDAGTAAAKPSPGTACNHRPQQVSELGPLLGKSLVLLLVTAISWSSDKFGSLSFWVFFEGGKHLL